MPKGLSQNIESQENLPDLIHQLMFWIGNGRNEKVQALIKKFPTLHSKQDTNGRYPLGVAVARGDSPMVKTLLHFGANPNIHAEGGNTPLHNAVATSHKSIITLLLSKGANIDQLNENNMSPLQLAIQQQKKEIVHLLLQSKIIHHLSGTDLAYIQLALQAYADDISLIVRSDVQKGKID